MKEWQKLIRIFIDYIVGYEEEQKYVIDFGNQVYGTIVTVGNRKEMYQVSSNPAGLIKPKEYTFDEITATDLSDYSVLIPVNQS